MAAAPGSDEIRAGLDRILASPAFLRAEKQSAFLRFIVESYLDGTAIRETDIGIAAYRRQPDYDPREDPIVRVEASRLRARLREYYSTDGKNDPIRIDLPKGTYLPVIARLAAPPPAEAAPAAPARSRKHWLAAALAVALVGGIGYWQFVRKPAAARELRAAAARTFRQASALHMQMTPAAVREARLLHEAVVRMDPTWATAYSGLSHTYTSLISVGGATRDELGPAALAAAQRSLQLDPLLSDGHAALIRYHRDVLMDFAQVEAACRTALEKTPGVPQILINCAPVQSIRGNHEIAELWAREAVKADPTWAETWYIQALVLWRAGRSADAKAPAHKAIEIDSKSIGARAILALIALDENQPDEAMRLMEWGLPAAGIDREEWYAYRGHVAARAGRTGDARKMYDRLDQRARTHVVSPVSFARIRVAERNTEAALTLIEEAVRRRDVEVAYFLTSPEAEPVKNNPRYRAAARALNLNPIP